MGTALFLSFLPSQKAILSERHMVGVTAAAADLQQLWLLTFQGEVGKALSLCAEQHSTVWVQFAPVTPQGAAPQGRCQPGTVLGLEGRSGSMSCTGGRQSRSHDPWPAVQPPLCCLGHRSLPWAGRKQLKSAPAMYDLFAPVLRLLFTCFTCALSLLCCSQRGQSSWMVVTTVALLFSSSGYPLFGIGKGIFSAPC